MWERAAEIAILIALLWIWSAYYLRAADRAQGGKLAESGRETDPEEPQGLEK